MKTFLEAKGDTAVFTFGRFNPPTTGHEKLIDALAKRQTATIYWCYQQPCHILQRRNSFDIAHLLLQRLQWRSSGSGTG